MALVTIKTRTKRETCAFIKAYLFKARNKAGYEHTRFMFKLSEKMLNDMGLEVNDKIYFLRDTEDSTLFAIRKNNSDEQSLKIGKTGSNFTLNIKNFSQEIVDKYMNLGTTILEHEIVDEGDSKLLKFRM